MVMLYSLESMPYYNSICQEYTNILTINKQATGPLKTITRQIRLNKLSPFETHNKPEDTNEVIKKLIYFQIIALW